jgi:hypothetical protein
MTKKNKQLIKQLTQVLGEVRRQEQYHNKRFYIPKVLKEKE